MAEVTMSAFRGGILSVLSVVVVTVLMLGCSDDNCTNARPQPTVDNIWPNEDGRFWVYTETVNTWDPGYSDGGTMFDCDDSPPPLPSWNQIKASIDSHTSPEPTGTALALYTIAFAGDTTSQSGVSGQNLRESVAPQGARALEASRRCPISPLIARLFMARPDLRSTIEAKLTFDFTGPLGQGEVLSGARF
jgi:hypothetical protein